MDGLSGSVDSGYADPTKPEQIHLLGNVTAEEGYLLYLDRKFVVKQGQLDFADPGRINPVIDLNSMARLEIDQTLENVPYEITLQVKGSLDQAKVDLTSVPALDKPNHSVP